MTKRSIAVLAVLALALATIGGWRLNNSIAVHAFESLSSTISPAQTVPDPKTVTWEYKVLTGSIPGVVVARVTSGGGMGRSFGPNVEEEINKLSAQGWVVESFQACCSRAGNNPPGVLYGPPEMTVLLRRMRK